MNNNNLRYFFDKHQLHIAIFLTLAMVYGFLAGRAILSISMFLFFVNTIWNIDIKACLTKKWWLFGLAWVGMYAVSYFWSDDLPYWLERFQVKFAFIIFPISMAFLPKISRKNLLILTFGIIALTISGCIYSLYFYFTDTENIINNIFKSKVFRTPAYKDHIRFSVFVAWVVVWSIFTITKFNSKLLKFFLIGACFFLVIYLHILAVRSGLLFLYSFSFAYILHLFFKNKIVHAILIAGISAFAFFIIFKTTPSFREKIYYGIHSIKEYNAGNESVDYSDIGRIVSFKLAYKIIKENPFIGVGSGDVREEMKKKYEQYYPDTKPEQMIVPHNQFLEVFLAGGLVTLIPFLIWVFYPIIMTKNKKGSFFIVATWFSFLMCLMVEAMLEMQFGVFVYLFGMLWMIKIVINQDDTTPKVQASL